MKIILILSILWAPVVSFLKSYSLKIQSIVVDISKKIKNNITPLL